MITRMTKSPRLLLLLALLLAPLAAAADQATLDAVRQADDARVVATKAGDRAALEAIFSDDLHYAHSSGTINDKKQYVAALAAGETKYDSITFEDRKFTEAGPGVVLVTGREILVESKAGKTDTLRLNFLGVWRLENGAWRFLAWQSNRLTP
jgi:ketosteroid isomerase-like protein